MKLLVLSRIHGFERSVWSPDGIVTFRATFLLINGDNNSSEFSIEVTEEQWKLLLPDTYLVVEQLPHE